MNPTLAISAAPSANIFRAAIAQHSKSFALAAKTLPRAVRADTEILYAWCRLLDDEIDLAPAAAQAAQVLQLHSKLRSVFANEPLDCPIWSAFQSLAFKHGLPEIYAQELIYGFSMDASDQKYASLSELLQYCYRVAGVVGLMMCHVMGLQDERGLRHAAHLGMAMQLTNICRDVAEDFERGRLYLPLDLLQASGVADLPRYLGQAFPQSHAVGTSRVIQQLLAEAARFYASGDAGLGTLEFRTAFGICAARHIYAEIGNELHKRGCDPLSGRAHVSAPRKLQLLLKALVLSLGDLPARIDSSVSKRSTRSTRVTIHQVLRFPEHVLPL